MGSLAAFLLILPSAATTQQPDSAAKLPEPETAKASAGIVPKPTLGWVLENNTSKIRAAFGGADLESFGTGSSPAIALDGAGNIDGAALIGGVPLGSPLDHYALTSPSDASLAAGTTVLLLCGREDNWLRSRNGDLLPAVAQFNQFSVTKPGEWGLSLASSVSPFAVLQRGRWANAGQPPIPASYTHFGGEPEFPPRDSNAPVCVWAFYDTSIQGTSSQPQISVAYDDGDASVPIKLPEPPLSSTAPLEVVFSQFGADLGTLFVWQGSAAKLLFQQPVRSAYWNGGLRSSIESGFQTPGWAHLAITNLDPRPIALGGDAQDNARANAYPTFVRTSPFTHYSVTTSPGAPFLAVRYQLGNAVYQPTEYSVSFVLDGQYLGYDQPWRFGTTIRSIPLPQDGKAHTLDLRNGFARNNSSFKDPTLWTFGGGGFFVAVAVPEGYTVKVNRPVPKSVALVLSHSVAVGELAGTAPYLSQGAESSIAWPVQARAEKAFGTESVVDESYGGELLANDCRTQADCTSYLAAIKAAQPNITVGFVARMLNDFYHGQASFDECLPQYQQMLGYLFNAWAAEFPGVPLHVGSDIRQSASREADTDGCTPALKLADWRAGIESEVSDYQSANGATWLHFVDMTGWVPQDELLAGGIHPTTKGQVEICQALAAYFRQNVTCGIPR